jgi:hypothetical protein
VHVYGCLRLVIRKFFDANGNGSWDAGETEIIGWPMSGAGVSGTPAAGITFSVRPSSSVVDAAATPLPAGDYTITEGLPSGWVPSFVYVGNSNAYSGSDAATIAAFSKGR